MQVIYNSDIHAIIYTINLQCIHSLFNPCDIHNMGFNGLWVDEKYLLDSSYLYNKILTGRILRKRHYLVLILFIMTYIKHSVNKSWLLLGGQTFLQVLKYIRVCMYLICTSYINL